jgi:uncharacterized ubiquitin-like protein YukD
MCAEITHYYERMGNMFFQVLSAHKEFSKNSVVQAVAKIRSQLLDLMLLLDNEFQEIDLSKLGESEKEKINQLIIENFTNQIVSGTGNIVSVAEEVEIDNKSAYLSNDILTDKLTKSGIAQGDIVELLAAIKNDEPDKENKKPGPKVKQWTKKMIGKSVDGSWQIGLGAAGELLATAIAKYYGF